MNGISTSASISRDSSLESDVSDGIENFLSKELLKLSVLDRNTIAEEIHGVECLAVRETPELIQRSLREFQKELDKGNIPLPNIPVHRLPNSGNNLVNGIDDDAFRLRFLRCELFNVPKAVRRFCNYLDYTYEKWGEFALDRPIMLKDFTKQEMKLFRKGFFQLLPYRDSSGRRVFVHLGPGELSAQLDLNTRDKCVFYLLDVATRDSIESQRKGVVLVRVIGHLDAETIERVSKENINLRSITGELTRMISAIPSRIIAVHHSIPNQARGFRLLLKYIVTKIIDDQNSELRSRIVFTPGGSDLETRYRLKTYGIPAQLIPLTDTGSIKCTYHNQWMKTRKILDEHEESKLYPGQLKDTPAFMSASAMTFKDNGNKDAVAAAFAAIGALVECPAPNDVVFRKGSRLTCMENPGNRFFRDLIRTFLEEKERVLEQLQKEGTFSSLVEQQDAQPEVFARFPPAVGGGGNDNTEEDDSFFPISTKLDTAAASENTVAELLGGKKVTGKFFCQWLIEYIEKECNGRFLDWNTDSSGWVVMSDKSQIMRKVSVTLYNWGKRLNNEKAASKKQQQSNLPVFESFGNANFVAFNNVTESSGMMNGNDEILFGGDSVGDDNNHFRFIDGRRPSFDLERACCGTSPTPTSGHKRPRREVLPRPAPMPLRPLLPVAVPDNKTRSSNLLLD